MKATDPETLVGSEEIKEVVAEIGKRVAVMREVIAQEFARFSEETGLVVTDVLLERATFLKKDEPVKYYVIVNVEPPSNYLTFGDKRRAWIEKDASRHVVHEFPLT